MSAFGFIGIVLGPLVAAILTALVESYQADRAELAAAAPGPSVPPTTPAIPEGGAPPSPSDAPPAG